MKWAERRGRKGTEGNKTQNGRERGRTERNGVVRKGNERNEKERTGQERNGKERNGQEKERGEGRERKGRELLKTNQIFWAWHFVMHFGRRCLLAYAWRSFGWSCQFRGWFLALHFVFVKFCVFANKYLNNLTTTRKTNPKFRNSAFLQN